MIDCCKAKFWTNRFRRRRFIVEGFKESHVKGFTEIHSRTPTLSGTLFCDNLVKLTVIFVILLHKTVVPQKLIRQ